MNEEFYTQFSRYSQPIFIVFGTIGAILNQILFSRQKALRSSSCSFYFRLSSINDLCVLYFVVFTQWITDQFHLDPTERFVWFCKVRTYLMYCLYAISPYCLVLGCFDRLCRTSRNSHIRQLATLPSAYQISLFLILIIMLIYCHIPYQFTVVHSLCISLNRSYYRFLGIFLLIFYCFLPSFLMSICCSGTLFLLNSQRKRHRNSLKQRILTGHPCRHSRDYHLIKLFLLYVVTNVICTLPFTVVFLINVYQKDSNGQILLLIKLAVLLVNLNYCTSFYVYTLGTPLYRRELVRLFTRSQH